MSGKTANILGCVALALWSMNIGVTRLIGEAHAMGMPGLSFFVSGLILILLDRAGGGRPPWQSDAAPRYWRLGGGAYVTYFLLYALSLSWSTSRAMALSLGLVNYQWASLTLLLMPLFFSVRIRWPLFVPGWLLCLAGIGFALLWGLSPGAIAGMAADNGLAFAMMLAAAFLWAFYSNAAKKWGGGANGCGWFQMTAGALLLALWLATGEPLGFTAAMVLPFAVHSLIINAAAYLFWDWSVRRGDIGLMGALANFLPIASALFGAWYLGDPTTPGLWIGCVLVTAGALLCGKAARQ